MDILFNIFGDNIRIVGGAVRNFLLKKPINDYDFSCLLIPPKIKELLQNNNVKYLTVGEKFGTITAIIDNKKYEITSTRKDIKTDGRWTTVEYIADFESDSYRRDLTINGLYQDKNGKIYDYHNGIDDLKNGLIKFIGDPILRIKEDYLRILRFFRFYTYYGKTIDKDSLKAIIILKKNLKKLTKERIKDEILKIFATNCVETLQIVNDIGILDILEINGNLKNIENFYLIKKFTPIIPFGFFIEKIPEWNFSKKERRNLILLGKSL